MNHKILDRYLQGYCSICDKQLDVNKAKWSVFRGTEVQICISHPSPLFNLED